MMASIGLFRVRPQNLGFKSFLAVYINIYLASISG